MEPGYRPTCNGDEQKGKERSRNDGAVPMNKFRHGRHFNSRRQGNHSDSEQSHHPQFHKSGQVIAWNE